MSNKEFCKLSVRNKKQLDKDTFSIDVSLMTGQFNIIGRKYNMLLCHDFIVISPKYSNVGVSCVTDCGGGKFELTIVKDITTVPLPLDINTSIDLQIVVEIDGKIYYKSNVFKLTQKL